MSKRIQKLIEQNPEIYARFDDERDVECGYWVYLKTGYINTEDNTHCIHEYTVKDVIAKSKFVKPCDCHMCNSILNRRQFS